MVEEVRQQALCQLSRLQRYCSIRELFCVVCMSWFASSTCGDSPPLGRLSRHSFILVDTRICVVYERAELRQCSSQFLSHSLMSKFTWLCVFVFASMPRDQHSAGAHGFLLCMWKSRCAGSSCLSCWYIHSCPSLLVPTLEMPAKKY